MKPVFDRILAYGIYDGVLKEVIHLIKFHQYKRLAYVLAAEIKQMKIPSADCIIPIPLSYEGLRKRGFNQSSLIARMIAKYGHIPLDADSLRKIRETRPQSSLPLVERKENVKNAFVCDSDMKDKSILLVDDVVTTGATVNECAKALKKAGADSVTVIVAARARLS